MPAPRIPERCGPPHLVPVPVPPPPPLTLHRSRRRKRRPRSRRSRESARSCRYRPPAPGTAHGPPRASSGTDTEYRAQSAEHRVPRTGTANGAPDAALQGPVSVRWAPHPRRRAPATGCSPVAAAVPARPPARRSPRPPAAVLISEPPRASGNTRGCSGRAGGSAAP
ncbi:unnamed protein product [Coccothraustes coccothraustes]